jgi:hypothetical protein
MVATTSTTKRVRELLDATRIQAARRTARPKWGPRQPTCPPSAAVIAKAQARPKWGPRQPCQPPGPPPAALLAEAAEAAEAARAAEAAGAAEPDFIGFLQIAEPLCGPDITLDRNAVCAGAGDI